VGHPSDKRNILEQILEFYPGKNIERNFKPTPLFKAIERDKARVVR